SADPRFVDPTGGDFHLQEGSPAIDAGTSEAAPATDVEDRLRYDDPATPNTGAGATSYVDIGAYEFGGATRPVLSASAAGVDGGSGTITSLPAGIDCPTVCTLGFDPGTVITLTPTPAPTARFTGRSG